MSTVSEDERESWNDVPLTLRFVLSVVEQCLNLRMRFPDVGPTNETATVFRVMKTNVSLLSANCGSFFRNGLMS